MNETDIFPQEGSLVNSCDKQDLPTGEGEVVNQSSLRRLHRRA